jgi:hypothetical protein
MHVLLYHMFLDILHAWNSRPLQMANLEILRALKQCEICVRL